MTRDAFAIYMDFIGEEPSIEDYYIEDEEELEEIEELEETEE